MIISGQLNFLHNPNICDWSELANGAGIELNKNLSVLHNILLSNELVPMSKYHNWSCSPFFILRLRIWPMKFAHYPTGCCLGGQEFKFHPFTIGSMLAWPFWHNLLENSSRITYIHVYKTWQSYLVRNSSLQMTQKILLHCSVAQTG